MPQAPACIATTQTFFQSVFSRGSLFPLRMTSKTRQPFPVVDYFTDHFPTEVYKITTRSVFFKCIYIHIYIHKSIYIFVYLEKFSLPQNVFTGFEVRKGENSHCILPSQCCWNGWIKCGPAAHMPFSFCLSFCLHWEYNRNYSPSNASFISVFYLWMYRQNWLCEWALWILPRHCALFSIILHNRYHTLEVILKRESK